MKRKIALVVIVFLVAMMNVRPVMAINIKTSYVDNHYYDGDGDIYNFNNMKDSDSDYATIKTGAIWEETSPGYWEFVGDRMDQRVEFENEYYFYDGEFARLYLVLEDDWSGAELTVQCYSGSSWVTLGIVDDEGSYSWDIKNYLSTSSDFKVRFYQDLDPDPPYSDEFDISYLYLRYSFSPIME